MIVSITLSVILLAAMVYLAISRKSSFKIRVAALTALAAMIITVVVCLFRIFMTPAASTRAQPYPDMPAPPPAPPPNTMGLVLVVIILILLFMVVLFLSLREQRRMANNNNSSNNSAIVNTLKNKLDF